MSEILDSDGGRLPTSGPPPSVSSARAFGVLSPENPYGAPSENPPRRRPRRRYLSPSSPSDSSWSGAVQGRRVGRGGTVGQGSSPKDVLYGTSSGDLPSSLCSLSSDGDIPDINGRTSICRRFKQLSWTLERDLEKYGGATTAKGLVAELTPHKPSFILSLLQKWGTRVPEIESGETPRKRFRVNLAEAQRMRTRKLHCKMVQHILKMRVGGTESRGWVRTLRQYNRSRSARDPFLATSEYAIDDFVLRSYGNLLQSQELKKVSSLGAWQEDLRQNLDRIHYPLCGTRSGNESQLFKNGLWTRIMLAAIGGAFLIGAMWLMVLYGGLYSTLGTTTGFVTVFGLVMVFMLEEGKDVLGSTAAYAAVLVVFMGTSNA
ncbi:hypothetical protein CSAL01_04014 [Colletotrichum salicis]|uniref:DUF6594 domain-containing protein n=1 Tax=Colletotrichum salicis TaxID=1209931 RepID=A0A135UVH8_9PEZI|nr:hypothetical protein CSAL01_04014 [Colletotrichum salicis]